MKNESRWDYSTFSREQAQFEAQLKHDQFKRKINEKPRRKNKRRK